ncbi:MAG: hypothetical protein WCI48_08180 [Bacteroidota bacterium]|jgi:hypothetical protein
MRSRPGLTLVVLLLLITLPGISQTGEAGSNYNPVLANTGQFGLTFGPAIYYGDLNAGHFKTKLSTGLATSLFGQYYFSNSLGFRISLFSGILNGGIKTYEKNGLQMEDSFTGIILEGNLQMVINFSNLFFKPSPRRRFFVYGAVGLGFAGWYSKLTNKVYNFDSLQTNNPLTNFNASLVIPASLGFYYRVGNRLNLGLEYSYKTYFSDKLDNTTGGYPYDVVHYISLNISFNLGTGMAKERHSRPKKAAQLQPAEYTMTYPVYTPPVYSAPTYSPPTYSPPLREQVTGGSNPPVVRSKKPVVCSPPSTVKNIKNGKEYFSVQIFASGSHTNSAAGLKSRYHIGEEVRVEKAGNVARFMVGRCSDEGCAKSLKEKMQKKGIHDAFIVVYRNGKRYQTIK